MKKATAERLMTKLENISICLKDEVEFIEHNNHTSGNYTKEDLRRISNWAGSLAKGKFANNMLPLVQYMCAMTMTMCAQITEVIDKEV